MRGIDTRRISLLTQETLPLLSAHRPIAAVDHQSKCPYRSICNASVCRGDWMNPDCPGNKAAEKKGH